MNGLVKKWIVLDDGLPNIGVTVLVISKANEVFIEFRLGLSMELFMTHEKGQWYILDDHIPETDRSLHIKERGRKVFSAYLRQYSHGEYYWERTDGRIHSFYSVYEWMYP
jgi:hypothetical protein